MIQVLDKNGNIRTSSTTTTIVVSGDRYIHMQGLPSATWNIAHNLDFYPSVTVVDSSNRVVYGDVQYTDTNNIIVTFNAAFSGQAYLS